MMLVAIPLFPRFAARRPVSCSSNTTRSRHSIYIQVRL
jgi:hypothetical protein